MHVLVDTSAWSVVLRRPVAKKSLATFSVAEKKQQAAQEACVAMLKDLITDGRAVMLGAVRQELLSGIRTEAQFEKLRDALAAFPDLPAESIDHERAAQMFNQCQSAGVQGAHTDFLICAVAERFKLTILSLDHDFVHFQKCLPLRLYGTTISAKP